MKFGVFLLHAFLKRFHIRNVFFLEHIHEVCVHLLHDASAINIINPEKEKIMN